MKLDKESIIAISICMALLIAWPYIFKTDTIQQQTSVAEESTSVRGSGTGGSKATPKAPQASEEKLLENSTPSDISKLRSEAISSEQKEEPVELPKLPPIYLSSPELEAVIEPSRGGIANVILKNYLSADKKTPVSMKFFESPALRVEPAGGWKLVAETVLSDSEKLKVIERRFAASSGSEFILRQSFAYESAYLVDFFLEIINCGDSMLELPDFNVNVGELPPVRFVSGDHVRSEYQSVDICFASNQAVKTQSVEKKPFMKLQENPVLWVAVTNKYFALVLVPDEPFDGGNTMESVEFAELDPLSGEKTQGFRLNASGIIRAASLEPNAKTVKKFRYFVGPKEHRILKNLAPGTNKTMHFGWRWLEGISQFLLAGLVKLKEFSGSYGMSIILLTIIVKLIFWPFTEKANASMKEMQKIQPLVQEIRMKYKGDQQKMNAKLMQLYKEHKVNPLGGCLPIFLQIPVFLALYNTLDGAIELRHSQFLWARDLSLPDTIFSIPLGFATLPLNPLVLLMTFTMVVQQKLTPSAADPMQQKMMMLMPFIMLFMLYSLPSGLTLYWTVSQVISILQLLLNKYRDRKDENSPPQAQISMKRA